MKIDIDSLPDQPELKIKTLAKEIIKRVQYKEKDKTLTYSKTFNFDDVNLNNSYVNAHVKQLKKNRDYIFKKYKNLTKTVPEGAIYLFLKIPKNFKSDHSFCEFFFKRYNIAIVPGSSFGKKASRYIRVNFSKNISDVEKFIQNYLKLNAL